MDLSEHFRAIWARRWPILAASVVIAAAVFAWRSQATKVWRADAAVSVSMPNTEGGVSVEQDTAFLLQRYAELATTQPVVAGALRRAACIEGFRGLSAPPVKKSRQPGRRPPRDGASRLRPDPSGLTGSPRPLVERGALRSRSDDRTDDSKQKPTPSLLPCVPKRRDRLDDDDRAPGGPLGISIQEAKSKLAAEPSKGLSYIEVRAEGKPHEARALANGAADALRAAVEREQREALAEDIAPLRAAVADTRRRLRRLGPPGTRPKRAEEQERELLKARHLQLLDAITERRSRPTPRADVLSRAELTDDPVSPKPLREALLALLVALILTAELAVALAAWRRARRRRALGHASSESETRSEGE